MKDNPFCLAVIGGDPDVCPEDNGQGNGPPSVIARAIWIGGLRCIFRQNEVRIHFLTIILQLKQ